jgi:ABC-2 type transport system permease protein
MPARIRTLARYNPVDWAVQAGRGALSLDAAWSMVLVHLALLAGFAVVCTWLATAAFRLYRRSL